MTSHQTKFIFLGIEVYFPYTPYENKKIYMKKVNRSFSQKEAKEGLESPTGTGKILCLLCDYLAYLKYVREAKIQNNITYNNNNNNNEESDNIFEEKTKKRKLPVIFYILLTYDGRTNVIKELRKNCYRQGNAVLNSRN